MKKRLLSILLCCVMLVGLLPTTAFAAEETGHTHPICGATCTDGEHADNITWKPIYTEVDLFKAQDGYYYLANDVEFERYDPEVKSGVVLCLNGHSIRQTWGNRSVIKVMSGTFTLTDCKGGGTDYGQITHPSGNSGYGVFVNGGTFNLYGGNITKNNYTGVYIGSGTFNMYDGSISQNLSTAGYGGGVNVSKGCTFNMYGGSITGNKSCGGGGVYINYGGTFNLSGGSITGNTASTPNYTANGGGVFANGGAISVSGNPVVKDNTVSNSASNIYLTSNVTMSVKDMTSGAEVGITTETSNYPVVFSSACNTDYSGYFFADNANAHVVYNSNKQLQLAAGAESHKHVWAGAWSGNDSYHWHACTVSDCGATYEKTAHTWGGDGLCTECGCAKTHTHCICGGDAAVGDHTTHTEQTFLPWSGGDAGYKNGVAYVYLEQNITLNSNLTVSGGNTLYLCLHGNTLASNGTNKIVVEKGSRLVISDCSGGGVIKGATKGWGGTGIYVYQSTLDIFGGKITGGKVNGRGGGGAIALDDKQCVLNIYDGEISGNNGNQSGGAIFLNNKDGCGTVNLYGGKICSNTAKNGGAIYAANGGTINLIGGEISGNTSTNDGGAIYAGNGASIKITGTKLTENKARWGGAIILIKNCTLIMEKGEISKNEAEEGGAVSVFDTGSTFTLVNGSITGNSATDGGAVYLNQDNSIFNMGGGTISGNTATGNGGAVYANRAVSVMTMSGGTIENNTAGENGGAVYINKGQLNLMDAPVIRNNTVSGKANNVYLKNGKMLTAYYFNSTEKIGVTTETLPTKGNPVVFCEDSDKDYSDKFVSDKDGYMVYCNEDGHLALSTVFYTVTYRPGTEGTGSEAVDHKDEGETIKLRGETFTRTGYRQIGWALSEGGAQAYALGASYAANAPLVLYPVWEMKNGYTVNFVNDDDTPVGTRTVAWADTVLTNAPEVPAKGEGWDFKGWFLGETRVVTDTTYAALAKDDTVTSITLKAAWTDIQKPTVSGIEDGKTYCGSVRFTVTDNDAVQKVYDSTTKKSLTSESDGSYLLAPSADRYSLEITDRSGNVTALTVKVNNGHQYDGWETGDGKYWRACSVCGEQIGEKKDIPACVYQIPDTLCPQTDLVFTFTVPAGSTLETVEYDTGMRGDNISDSGLQRNQDGSYTATLPYSNFDTEGRVSLKIQAKTSDGYTFVTNLGEVTVLAEHPWGAWSSNHDGTHSRACTKDPSHTETKSCTGGEATCLAPATCADCGESYGDRDPQHHAKGTDWVCTETTHEKKYLCCGVVEVEKEAHEWDNGACTECGYGCMHTGGAATCTEKAVCDTCGQPYGELAPDAHTRQAVWTTTAETHTKTYPCCGAVEVDQKPHKWANGACTECGYECLHIGGEATCAEQATCAICGEKYGDLKPHSYSTAWSTDETHHWHECTECGAKTDKAEHTDTDRDHKCDLCDRTFSEHSGGTATCADKAKCEVCGESYGELNANNHTDLKCFPAKAATRTSEGNIAYWYCSGCGKYYKDAEATQEITKEQTITAKLPSHTGGSTGADTGNKPDKDAVTSPNTGDNSKLALWSVTLCGSLAACLALAAAQRRRKRER